MKDVTPPTDDHLSKALQRAQSNEPSVRDWNKPSKYSNVLPTRDPGRNGGSNSTKGFGTEIELDLKHLHSKNLLSNLDLDDALIVDRYRLLRTRIRQLMKPRDWTRLGITSPSAKEGKSVTAINLALTAAREGIGSVLLLDADLRRPAIADYLGIDVEKGLLEYLNEDASLDDIVYQPKNIPNLYVIPTRADEDALMGISLGSNRMEMLLDSVSSNLVLTIVDLPPTLVADDVLSAATLLDALAIVIRDGKTRTDELTASTELLADFNLLGTVLNDCESGASNAHGYYFHKKSSSRSAS